MTSPANGSANNPTPRTPSAHSAPRASRQDILRGLISAFLFLSGFVLWPIYFVVGMLVGLWRARHQLFPFRARVCRQHFWSMIGLYLCLGGLVLACIYGAAQDHDLSAVASDVLYGVIGAAIASSAATVAVGRLHDRDMSGWWILLYYGIPAAAIAGLISGELSDAVAGLGGLVITIFVLWAVFALGCRRGTAGPNRFGPEMPWGRRTPKARPPRPQAKATGSPADGAASTAVRSAAGVSAGSPPVAGLLPAIVADHRGSTRRGLRDLFSFRGRLDRKRYWIGLVIQCAYGAAAWVVITAATRDRAVSNPLYWTLVGLLAFLPAGISAAAATLKRLHDRNLSGWWLPAICLVAFLGGELLNLIFNQEFLGLSPSLSFAILVVAIWTIGKEPGTDGPNPFGPDPVEPPAMAEGPPEQA